MDFAELIKALGENADAVKFVNEVQTKMTKQNEDLKTALEKADRLSPFEKEVEKYKDEAKKAFEDRDKYKEQLKGNKEPDRELLEKIEAMKFENTSLKSQILEKEKNEVLNGVLAKMQFKGEGEVQDRMRDILRSELSRGLIKHDELGWVYADDKGNPKRNPSDVASYLNPKSIIETDGMKAFITTLTGVPSTGDGFQGQHGGGDSKAPQTFKEMQKAIFK